MNSAASTTLMLYVPEIPSKTDWGHWLHDLLLFNIGERLMEFDHRGDPAPAILDSCSLARDGANLRIQLNRTKSFHDGSVLTADEVIETLLTMSHHGTELSLFGKTLKDQNSLDSNFKKTSRHKLEIYLKKPVSDLMNYLASPESTVLKQHDITKGTGLWKICVWLKDAIDLSINENHPQAEHSCYQSVQVRTLNQFESHDPELPYILIAPGFLKKAPRANILNHQIKLELSYQFSAFFVLKTANEDLAIRLEQAAEALFKKKSLWQREKLDSLSPVNSPLHFKFKRHHKPQDKQPAIKVRLAKAGMELPAALQESLRTILIAQEVELEWVSTKEEHDGTLCVIASPTLSDTNILAEKLWQFARTNREVFKSIPEVQQLKKAAFEIDVFRRSHIFRDLMATLNRSQQFVPFMKSPLIVQSNRLIEQESSAYLKFIDVKKSLKVARDEELKVATLSAIGSAVQMFAHDVKKPFSMVQSFVSLMEHTDDPQKIKEMSIKHLPRIRQTIKRVDGLIYDIIEIGSNSEIIQEPYSLHELIEASAEEAFGFDNDKNVELTITTNHTHKVDVDPLKIRRVLTNIITNAYQATKVDGSIWISTEEICEDYVNLRIKNSDSFIPEDQIAKIFDAFYTKGKKRGTGLGLAIAKKIIAGHGGEITCHSSLSDGTQFEMTIPQAQELEVPQVASHLTKATAKTAVEPLSLIIADDSRAYLELVKDMIASLERPGLKVDYVSSIPTLLQKAQSQCYDLMIIDINFGETNYDGFTALAQIRSQGIQSLICLHSDAPVIDYQKRALLAGADLFLPKPITAAHLEKLFISCEKSKEEKEQIWIIDDDPFFTSMWQDSLEGVRAFSSPQEALAALPVPSSVKAVIIDYTFENSEMDGIELARQLLHQQQMLPKMFLCSDRLDLDDKQFESNLPKDIEGALSKLRQFIPDLLV